MIFKKSRDSGFTAVELMVTLFVAVLFIMSGYMLYDAVSSRSANTREMAEASNVAYEVLRNEGSAYRSISTMCSATPPSQTVTRSDLKIPSPTITIKRCKPFADSMILQVTVVVQYGPSEARKEAVHATYVSN